MTTLKIFFKKGACSNTRCIARSKATAPPATQGVLGNAHAVHGHGLVLHTHRVADELHTVILTKILLLKHVQHILCMIVTYPASKLAKVCGKSNVACIKAVPGCACIDADSSGCEPQAKLPKVAAL